MTNPDFGRLFNSLPGLLVVINRDYRVVAANKEFTQSVLAGQHTFSDKEVFELFRTDKLVLKASCDDALANRQTDDVVFTDEKSNSVRIEFMPVQGENGMVEFVVLKIEYFNHDAAPSESSEDDIKGLFADLFEFNPAALVISRLSDSKIIRVNKSFLDLFDFMKKEELLGKTAEQLNILNAPEQRNEILRQFREGKKTVSIEGSVQTNKGNIKWVAVSLLVVTLNTESCLMAVILDITERKTAEDKIRSNNAELEELVAKRTQAMMETELEYRSIVEQATDGIFISDAKGKYIDVSPSASNMLGYSKEEFLNLTIQDVLFPEEAIKRPPKFSELMDGKTILTTRNLKHKDGSALPVEINARMLTNGRMLGMVRDITQRKKEEENIQKMNAMLEEKVLFRTAELENKIQQLRASEDKFQKAFNASSAGITLTRLSDSRYVEVNDAFLDMIGYPREEVLNHSSADLGLIVNMKRREEVLKEIRERGSVRHMEMTVRKKSGEHLEILASIETITDAGEQIAINIIYDITELKRAQEKLEAVNKELESFSYSVSHDLRAPLRAIIGYAGIIQEDFKGALNKEINTHLNTIQKNASRMGQLIDDLLEFSKLGKQELVKSNVDTLMLVDKNVNECKALAQTKAEFILYELLPSYADLSMLSQVWFNLISNAIKYSSKKEKPVIEIGSYPLDNEIIFYIKDNGAGFKMDYAHKLFGVFQRLHGFADYEGTGVGLALVKRIIDKHEGRVWAEGKIGEGASFFFSLPVEKVK